MNSVFPNNNQYWMDKRIINTYVLWFYCSGKRPHLNTNFAIKILHIKSVRKTTVHFAHLRKYTILFAINTFCTLVEAHFGIKRFIAKVLKCSYMLVEMYPQLTNNQYLHSSDFFFVIYFFHLMVK